MVFAMFLAMLQEMLLGLQAIFYIVGCLTLSAVAYLVLMIAEDVQRKRRRLQRGWSNARWREQSSDIRGE